ncbi:MAG TPA: RNA polymerase sigma factor, partial [Gemmatimonadaceae bacterium]|nr:RNA polymerase sigma factor [Gemmatimonadaceae bacterium]
MSTQPYISRSMSRRRFRRKERKATAEANAVVYRDRSSWALDAQLASLASAGDDAAFTTLVTRFQPAVFRWALIFARDPDEAEDITQEVFVRTHRQIGDYRSDGPLEAWLYRITRRAATQMRRKRGRRGRLALTPAARPAREVYTTDPGGRVDRERAATVIRELFAALPQRQRE